MFIQQISLPKAPKIIKKIILTKSILDYLKAAFCKLINSANRPGNGFQSEQLARKNTSNNNFNCFYLQVLIFNAL